MATQSRVDTAAEYNEISSAYATSTSEEELWTHTTTYTFKKYVTDGREDVLKGAAVLDLGCGTGLFSRWAASQGASRVVGVDISEQQILNARRLTGENTDCATEYIVGDAKAVDEAELGQFDVIFAVHLFCYSQNQEELCRMLSIASSCLKKGGRLIGVRECFDSSSKGRVSAKARGEIKEGPLFSYEFADDQQWEDFGHCKVTFRNTDGNSGTFTVFPVRESTMVEMFTKTGFKINSMGPRLTCSPEGRKLFPPDFIKALTDDWGQLMWYFDVTK